MSHFYSAFAVETPSISYFGSSLQNHLDDQGYSVVLKKCLSYLMRSKAYTKEGIFRIAGQVTHIILLRGAIDNDKADDSLLDLCGVDVIVDVLKQYLRELPEPLLGSEFIENWPSKAPPPTKIISMMREHLPEANRKNFLLLLQFLLKVCKNEEASKMSADNLALTLWVNLCPNSTITEGATIVKHLFTYAEDLVAKENCFDVLESLSVATIATPPIKVIQTIHKPQKPERTYPMRPSAPEISQKVRPLAPPPPPISAPNYSPQVSVNEAGNPSAANIQPGPVGDAPYQQQQSLPNVPVTTFDNSSYRRACSALETNAEKGVPKTPPLLPNPAPPLSSSDTSVGREHSMVIAFDTESPRREGTPSHPTSVVKDRTENKEEGEEEDDDESEGTTSSENSVSPETSTTGSPPKVVDKHKQEQENRNDAETSKKKKEEVEKRSEKSSSVKHLKTEEDGKKKKEKANVKMRSDGIDAHGSRKADSSENVTEFISKKQDLDQKCASSGGFLGSKNISNASADEVGSPRERKK
ncbi:SH3 domain-binding protein 1 [Taenia solium]|eukprot:TsM_000057300 transcript=TsM_000057300 gene=TsM_000057300